MAKKYNQRLQSLNNRADGMFSELDLIEESIAKSAAKNQLIYSAGIRNIIQAMIVAEDRRFFFHRGVDLRGIARAILKFLLGSRLEGASTIEQQFVRTVRERYDVTFARKLTECFLAVIVSSRHSKALLAYSYLEVAYFGWRANGVHQAAQRLGVDLVDASKSEAAALAAMLKVPMPRVPSQRYVARHAQRVEYILNNWNEVGKRNGCTF